MHDRLGEARKIPARMKTELIVEANARATDEWHVGDKCGVEPAVVGQRRFCPKLVSIAFPAVRRMRVMTAGTVPHEIA